MGQSPRADLFFGYVFNEPTTLPWQGDDYDYDAPEAMEKEYYDTDDWIQEVYAIDKHLEYKQKKEVIEKKVGVSVEHWGYLEEPSYYITPMDPRATHTNWWDNPKQIPIDALEVNPVWPEKLEAFAEKMGIDLKGQIPQWHLVASYG